MFWNVLKMIWVIWVTVVCVAYCSTVHVPVAYGQEFLGDGGVAEYVTAAPAPAKVKPLPLQPSEYIVVAGDTLGDIASRYNTTWEQLWELNRDCIVDPNLIHIGQKIRVSGKPAIPPPPPLTRDEKVDKLAKFMFRKSGLPPATKTYVADSIIMYQTSFKNLGLTDMDAQRITVGRYYELTRQYEIWLLAEALVDTANDDETFYKLVGLAWQESHFVNKPGKAGEVSFFQFLPSTVKARFQLDDIGLVNKLWELKNGPRIATELALEMMTEYRWNIKYWNNGENFQYHLNNKIYWFRSEWRKR